MPAQIKDARLDVYRASSSRSLPDVKVPFEDIRSFEIVKSYQDDPGGGNVEIDNGEYGTEGTYNSKTLNGERYQIDIGDRVEIRILTEHNQNLTLDDTGAVQWTALITDLNAGVDTSGNYLDLTLVDFALGILQRRTVAASFRDRAVSGLPGRVINAMVSENAPEIQLDEVDINTTIDATFNYTNLLEGINDIAEQTGSYLASEGRTLKFQQIEDLSTDYTLTGSDIQLPIDNGKSDEELINEWYVTGGRGESLYTEKTAVDGGEELPDQDALTTRNTIEIPVTDIPRVDIYTQTSNNEDAIRVAVQEAASDGTAIDPLDRSNDFGSDVVEYPGLSQDGWTPFNVNVTDAKPLNGFALVFETVERGNNTTNHVIRGNDTDGDASTVEEFAYRIYTGFDIISIASDNRSQTAYRTYEGRTDTEIQNKSASDSLAQTKISRTTPPREALSFNANSEITHQAEPADVFELTVPAARVDGQWGITSVSQTYEENQLETEVEAFNIDSL
jgi:hypothetical protein